MNLKNQIARQLKVKHCQTMSKIKRWKVLKMGIPKAGKLRDVLMACMKCGEESQLALIGSPLAQVDSGFVFDTGPHWMPETVRCPHCGSTLEKEGVAQ